MGSDYVFIYEFYVSPAKSGKSIGYLFFIQKIENLPKVLLPSGSRVPSTSKNTALGMFTVEE